MKISKLILGSVAALTVILGGASLQPAKAQCDGYYSSYSYRMPIYRPTYTQWHSSWVTDGCGNYNIRYNSYTWMP